MPVEYYEAALVLGGFLAICSVGLLAAGGLTWLARKCFTRPMATRTTLIRRCDDYPEYP